MKAIIYLLIVIMLFGSISTSCMIRKSSVYTVTLQPADTQLSAASLEQSARIIAGRLKDFSNKNFRVNPDYEKNQIQVILSGKWDPPAAERLISQKGNFSFYTVYTSDEMGNFPGKDNLLCSFLTDQHDPSGKLGCVPVSGIEKIKACVDSAGPELPCRLVWAENPHNDEACLYAIKPAGEQEAVIGPSDIESMKAKVDKKSEHFSVGFTLKKRSAGKLAKASRENFDKVMLFMIDDVVIFTPVIKSEITNGKGTISGNFSREEVKFIEAIGNNGVFPVDFIVLK